MGSLPNGIIPTFEILLYSLVILLFLVTGFLNVKDLKIMKQDKWTRQDSVALTLRVLFYGFLLNFLLTLAIDAAILFLTFMRSSSLEQAFPLTLIPLEFSAGALVVMGLIYGVAKWRDWFDLVDAED
jgi:hypothetical protein